MTRTLVLLTRFVSCIFKIETIIPIVIQEKIFLKPSKSKFKRNDYCKNYSLMIYFDALKKLDRSKKIHESVARKLFLKAKLGCFCHLYH